MTNYLRDEGRMSAVVIVDNARLYTEEDEGDISCSIVKTDLVEQIT